MSSPLDQRPIIIAMRVSKSGHDVPTEKLKSRYPRTMNNLRAAIHVLPHGWIFYNDDLNQPFRRVAVFEQGRKTFEAENAPTWIRNLSQKFPRFK
jgi:predicted ABC-type ATPase